MTPVFFISFANTSINFLPSLEQESEIIYRILTERNQQGAIQIHREPYATIENTAHHLSNFCNRVRLFHYGGHANQNTLLFKDQHAHSSGIAHLLALQKSLKLVFLNGCSTHQQVHQLLALGIPAVIATSSPIGDQSATQFAQQFYQNIALGFTIKQAFKQAAAFRQSQSGNLPKIYRDLIPPSNEFQHFPWGLYTQKEALLEEVLISNPKPLERIKNKVVNTKLEAEEDIRIGDKPNTPEENHGSKNIIIDSEIKGRNITIGDG